MKDDISDLTAEAVLGVTLDILNGKSVPPRWMVMSDEAKAKYADAGRAAVEAYKVDEVILKKLRESGNPRAFFM